MSCCHDKCKQYRYRVTYTRTASAGKARAGIHSIRAWTRRSQVKLCDPLATRAISERFCDEVASQRVAVSSVPYFTFIFINKIGKQITRAWNILRKHSVQKYIFRSPFNDVLPSDNQVCWQTRCDQSTTWHLLQSSTALQAPAALAQDSQELYCVPLAYRRFYSSTWPLAVILLTY